MKGFPRPTRKYADIAYDLLTAGFGISVLVFPNVFREVKVVLMLMLIVLQLSTLHTLRFRLETIAVFFAGAAVSCAFILRGSCGGADTKAVWQTLLIYVLSPAFWLIYGTNLFQRYSTRKIVNWILACGVLGGITVLLFYFFFLYVGSQYLTFLIEQPNMSVSDEGVVAAWMHVFGSLIFIFPAFWGVAALYGRYGMLMMLFFISIAFVSGRDALVICTLLGALAYFWSTFWKRAGGRQVIMILFQFALVFAIFHYVLGGPFNVSIEATLDKGLSKISEFGGDERRIQFVQLWNGAMDNYLLGAGHGVGVEIKRNDTYPWRYEVLGLATLYRVGVFGLIVYSYPVIISVCRYLRLRAAGRLVEYDRFFLYGLLAIVFASNTNPYLESFEFQWMIFLPYLYFSFRTEVRRIGSPWPELHLPALARPS